jgi:hypothetical protein
MFYGNKQLKGMQCKARVRLYAKDKRKVGEEADEQQKQWPNEP